jgi:predicted Rossmann fold nucleotide-binding protein DprA/Smf involved in DNA uptake
LRPAERGFLLLGSCLGNPERRPLTAAQLRTLAQRVRAMARETEDRDIRRDDLTRIGYSTDAAERILALLAEEDLLNYYLCRGQFSGCVPLTRITEGYPEVLRQRLGLESPACLWAKGDLSILERPRVALVGSREIRPENREFAWEAGRQAALQGYVLVSGNARGSDKIAQTAALRHGGSVISVVADALAEKTPQERVLYLSEEDYDQAFSAQRALRRNRVIHALGEVTLVAQCDLGTGGTWSGTTMNLKAGWSPVYCFDDGSDAAVELEQMGAVRIPREGLTTLHELKNIAQNLFDQ